MKSIFLSYSSKDKFSVNALSDKLKEFKITVWLYEVEIEPGDSITSKIEAAINDKDFFGIVLSKHSIKSKWVQRELKAAMAKEIESSSTLIIPILIDKNIEIPIFLKDKLYVDLTDSDTYMENFRRLLKKLGVKEKIQELPDPEESQYSENIVLKNEIRTKNKVALEEFVDIKIVDMDVERIYQPDENSSLKNYYFRLSCLPPYDWEQIFLAIRRFPRHSMWRRAWIEGSYVVVYCMFDEIEKYHFKDITQDVEEANTKYRFYLSEKAKQEIEELTAELEEKKELEDLRKRIGFS